MYLSEKHAIQYATKYETPLYIYDADIISQSYKNLQAALTNLIKIFYSVKANPSLAICQLLCKLGAGAEICSMNELQLVKMAGFTPDKIIVVGPYKDDDLLISSIDFEVYAIVCESLTEFIRIEKIATILNKKINVLLRVNPDTPSVGALLKMGGKATQFGMSEQEVFIISKEHRSDFVRIIGIHGYLGTRILKAGDIVQNIRILFKIYSKVKSEFLNSIFCIDIGGGFGVNYFEGEEALNLNLLKESVENILSEYSNIKNATIIAESGRYLIAESGLLILKVRDIKKSFGEEFVITDGGINCFMAAGKNSILQKNFPITSSSKRKKRKLYHICGPLCTPGDLIAKKIELNELKVGDYIFMSFAGAYGLTASPVLFLSQKMASEVMLYQKKDFLIRSRESISSSYLTQNKVFFE